MIPSLETLYNNPVLVFYWYYFKRDYQDLKQWRRELDNFRYADPDHPLRKFVEIIDHYGK